MDQSTAADESKQIEICGNGPYMVCGNIPLVRKIQVVSEFGEPLTWRYGGEIPAGDGYFLCRCGQSGDMPFCDGTHARIQFDGKETAPDNRRADRAEPYPGSSKITISMDASLCTGSGFCANRFTSIAEIAAHTDDIQVRTMAIAMIEHCPSGALTYALEGNPEDIEVDLPQQVAVTTEITSEGAIRGPLWVTGGVQIVLSDGTLLEKRNRVTLCNCGHSQNKPLCDGSHRDHPVFIQETSTK